MIATQIDARRPTDASVLAPGAVAAALLLCDFVFNGAFLLRYWGPIAAFALTVVMVRGIQGVRGAAMALVLAAWGYGAWSLGSAAWADSPERAIEGGVRNLFYASLLTLPLVAINTRHGAIKIAKVVVVGLGIVVTASVVELWSGGVEAMVAGRLDAPIGYRNGTAALMAAAAVVLVCVAAWRSGSAAVRAAAFSVGVMALALAWLTQSRGVVLGFAAAAAVAVCLGPERLRRGLLLLCAVGAVAIAADALAAPYDTFMTERETRRDDVGHATNAVLVLGLGCWLFMLAIAIFDHGLRPKISIPRIGRRIATTTSLLVLGIAVAGGVAAAGDPLKAMGDRVEEFNSLEQRASNGSRLGSTGGQRADLWRIALDEFRGAPLVGVGEGSYSVGYYKMRRTDRNVTNSHSFPLAALAETGLLGAVLLLVAAGSAAVVFARRWQRADESSRRWASLLIATAAVVIAQATIDWLWLIPALMGLALFSVGLAIAVLGEAESRPPVTRRGRAASGAVRAVAAAATVAAGALVISDVHVRDAAALRAGPADQQLAAARSGQALNPLALRPRYLAASALERLGRRGEARSELLEALDREPRNFVTLALLGDLEMRAGRVGAARARYGQSLALNPRDIGLRKLASGAP